LRISARFAFWNSFSKTIQSDQICSSGAPKAPSNDFE
jgi:hypothetical protein